MTFCAWRDQIMAQRVFRHAVGMKARQLVACKAEIEKKAAQWERSRDRSCAKQAQQEHAGGSIRPMVQSLCSAAQTKELTSRIERIHECPSAGVSQ
jgi:uncharacterized protein YecT (DUF1311 family)